MKKTLNFKTNTLLKNLVGKDLINDDNIAIVELVKNSYDAQSDSVIVRFTNFSDKGISTESSQIIIADQGFGMDLADIEDKWLNIAYSEKVMHEQKKGAYLAGNKGIGRFSCDRLGQQLDLLTRKKGNDLFHLKIWWPDFEVEGDKDLTIQDIKLEITSVEEKQAVQISGVADFPETGTILVISSLRETWNREKLRELKTALEKFLNPNQLFERNQFKVILSIPDIEDNEKGKSYPERISGEIQNQIFEKLKFNTTYIEASVSEDNERVMVDLFHEGEKVLELIERNAHYPLLAGAHIIIYYLNPYKKAYFKRQTGVRSVDFGSIFLFLNGFRIAPYGDRGDDWLGLDVRSAQGYARNLGSRNIVGRIEISGSEEHFKPVSSREGLKKTDAFNQLREGFFIDVLRKLERFVVDGLNWDSIPLTLRTEVRDADDLDWENTSEQYSESWERKKQRIVLSIMTLIGSSPERIIKFWFNPSLLEGIYESRQEEVKNLLSEIEGFEKEKIDDDLILNISKFRGLIEQKEAESRAAKSEAADLRVELVKKEEKISKIEGEKETYRSQSLFFQQITPLSVPDLIKYLHQIKLDSTSTENYITKAIKTLRNGQDSKDALENLQKASFLNKRISSLAQFATKADFRSGVKQEPTDIPAFFERYLTMVAKDFIASGLNLDVTNSVREPFEMRASRVELSILIDNLISNASKANAKTMFVEITKLSTNTIQISFIDDGKGLSKDLPNLESIFEMGITTTTGGSGLGLFQAKNIVDKLNGKISAIPVKPNGLEIRMEMTR